MSQSDGQGSEGQQPPSSQPPARSPFPRAPVQSPRAPCTAALRRLGSPRTSGRAGRTGACTFQRPALGTHSSALCPDSLLLPTQRVQAPYEEPARDWKRCQLQDREVKALLPARKACVFCKERLLRPQEQSLISMLALSSGPRLGRPSLAPLSACVWSAPLNGTLVHWWPVLLVGEACSRAEGSFSGLGLSRFGFLSGTHFRVELQGYPSPGVSSSPGSAVTLEVLGM